MSTQLLVPAEMLSEMDRAAAEAGVSRAEWVRQVVAAELARKA